MAHIKLDTELEKELKPLQDKGTLSVVKRALLTENFDMHNVQEYASPKLHMLLSMPDCIKMEDGILKVSYGFPSLLLNLELWLLINVIHSTIGKSTGPIKGSAYSGIGPEWRQILAEPSNSVEYAKLLKLITLNSLNKNSIYTQEALGRYYH